MIDRTMSAVMGRMAAGMSAEQRRAMMAEMMGRMFAGMDLADKIAFMQAMVGACIPQLTAGLEPGERAKLVSAILARMADELGRAPGTATRAGQGSS